MATNVVIIGGGVMGCSIALRLAQKGAQVTVLERSIPGAEASSAAGGILAPQKEVGSPGPFLDLCVQSRKLYPAFAEELKALSGVDIAYLPCGVMTCAFDEATAEKLKQTVAWQREAKLNAEYLTGPEARRREPSLSEAVLGAALFPDDAQVDNRLLVRALTMAAARVGVRFRSGYVRSLIVEDGQAVAVDLDGELLGADAFVIAAGSWSGLIHGAQIDPRTVRPARGQMLQLQTRLPLFTSVLFGPRGYLVPRADGRVIAGSTMEMVGFEKQVTAGGMARILSMALELCPALESAAVGEFWAGLRPYTEDHLPILGRGPAKGLFLATGHFRNGILLTPATAQLIAAAVLDEPLTADLSPFRYDRFQGA